MNMTVPSLITYELEICYFGMTSPDAQSMTLAETLDEVTSWDVVLFLRLEQTGQIETLFDKTFDNSDDATEQFRILEDMFPDASHNIHEPPNGTAGGKAITQARDAIAKVGEPLKGNDDD